MLQMKHASVPLDEEVREPGFLCRRCPARPCFLDLASLSVNGVVHSDFPKVTLLQSNEIKVFSKL